MSDESCPRTLYVGNLDMSVSEDLLCTLFAQIGSVKGCKIIRDLDQQQPYAFVEFSSHQYASMALTAMNKRLFLDKEMKVNWATSPGNQPKTDTSNHHHIFVGDLSPEIETETLREAFAPFGEISNCRIVRDPQTLKSKGYAFVSFVKKAEAETAIQSMNGQWLGSRSIRTNWSTRKPPPPRAEKPRNNKPPSTYEEVYNQSSPTNSTVYCGGFANGLNGAPGGISEELMTRTFAPFGTIQDIRVFKDKGYAFIRFAMKDSAAHAIETVNNTEINGQLIKCFWGKENGGPMHGGGEPMNNHHQQQQQQQHVTQHVAQQQATYASPYATTWYGPSAAASYAAAGGFAPTAQQAAAAAAYYQYGYAAAAAAAQQQPQQPQYCVVPPPSAQAQQQQPAAAAAWASQMAAAAAAAQQQQQQQQQPPTVMYAAMHKYPSQ